MGKSSDLSLSQFFVNARKSVSSCLLELLFPSQCRICARLMRDRDGLCADCWRQIHFIERPYCEILGIPFAMSHGEGTVSALAISQAPPFERLRSVVIHQGPAKRLSQQLKYNDRSDLVPMLANWMVRASDGMIEDCDVIVSVPLHKRRLMSRRFNQSAELARQVSKLKGKKFLPAALLRKRMTRPQVGLTALGRQENVKGAFAVAQGFEKSIVGKKILLIDDVYTTGATVSAVARALKRAGADKVFVLTFAMAITQPI